MEVPARYLLWLIFSLGSWQALDAVISFGTGNAGQVCLGSSKHLFSHEVSRSSNAGVMSHFWTTGSSEQSMAAAGIELRFNYAFDGELVPSISFEPAKAAGQFFGAVEFNGKWVDGTRAATLGNLSMFSAGDKVGKNAVTQGWWHQTKMPFQKSVNVSIHVVPRPGGPAPRPGACAKFHAVVRGYEVQAQKPLLLPSGFEVPSGARLELHVTDVVAPPNAFTSLLNISVGREALIYGLGLGLKTSPPWGTQVNGKLRMRNNYVEGCWSLLRTHREALPGQVLGTGLEDLWDSAYGFSFIDPGVAPLPPSSDTDGEIRLCQQAGGRDTVCPVTGAPFQHPSAGVLHFSSDYTASMDGIERFSGYRFFDSEVVGMDDGGQFGWTNGCAAWNAPGTNKCGVPPLGAELQLEKPCQTSPTHITAYVWVYTWPKSGSNQDESLNTV